MTLDTEFLGFSPLKQFFFPSSNKTYWTVSVSCLLPLHLLLLSGIHRDSAPTCLLLVKHLSLPVLIPSEVLPVPRELFLTIEKVLLPNLGAPLCPLGTPQPLPLSQSSLLPLSPARTASSALLCGLPQLVAMVFCLSWNLGQAKEMLTPAWVFLFLFYLLLFGWTNKPFFVLFCDGNYNFLLHRSERGMIKIFPNFLM